MNEPIFFSGKQTTRCLILTSALFISGYGLYLLYKSKKARFNHDIEYYDLSNNFIEDEDSGLDAGYEATLRSKNQIANRYNQSKILKPSSKSKLGASRTQRQIDQNSLLNLIQTKLTGYPPIMARPFKTLNARCVDVRSQFRVMQWNGLGKNFIEGLKSPNVPKELHDWKNFRQWRLLEELVRYNCDIICIEEADFYEDIKPHLHYLGFASVFCPKVNTFLTKEDGNVDSDGSAIFYNLDTFSITQLRSQSICLNGEHDSQVFIIIQLKHRATKKTITVVCVHLKAFGDYIQKRAEQTDYIMKVLKEHVLLQDSGYTQPVIICGDMNGDFLEPFYNLIVKDDTLKLTDVYGKHTSCNRRQKNAIDYIFYTNANLNLINFLELETARKRRHFEIPNLEYPSDHFSLVCDFQIK